MSAAPGSILERRLTDALAGFRRDGVYKQLNHIETPQDARVQMEGRAEAFILSSNNYLGLSDHPDVVAAGHDGLDGLVPAPPRSASSRDVTIHRELEAACARLVGTESALSL